MRVCRYFSCIDCGKETIQTYNNTRKRCPDCVKIRTYAKIDERKSRLIAEGKCWVCAKERDEDSPSKNMCSKCIGKHNTRQNSKRILNPKPIGERFCKECKVSLGIQENYRKKFCDRCIKNRRNADKLAYLNKLKAEGKCIKCREVIKEKSSFKNLCILCADLQKEASNRSYNRRKKTKPITERFCETCEVSLGYITHKRFCSECMKERLSKSYKQKLVNKGEDE